MKGVEVNKKRADLFASNVLPIIEDIRKAGISSRRGIANALNRRGVATMRQRKWYSATVRNIEAHAAHGRQVSR
jgi:hypothetical protein